MKTNMSGRRTQINEWMYLEHERHYIPDESTVLYVVLHFEEEYTRQGPLLQSLSTERGATGGR